MDATERQAALRRLSAQAAVTATECSRRGDTEGSFYARGCRDAYANAAVLIGAADSHESRGDTS